MAVDPSLSVASLYTVFWCFLHSLLLSQGFSRRFRHLAGNMWRWHRVVYNMVSAVTLLPLLVYLQLINEQPLFLWTGWFTGIRFILLAAGLLLFYGGSRMYDFQLFIGLTQLRSGESSVLLSGDSHFQQDGILSIIRHPWYGGGILFLWSIRSEYGVTICTIYTIFTVYLIIGAFLEEKRLEKIFGEEYRRYKRDVSMFVPYKWVKKRFSLQR